MTSEDSAGVTKVYAYDVAGRQISKTIGSDVTTYTWIDNDRMASLSSPTSVVNYTYDAEGSRIKEDDGTNPKWYLIDKQLPYGQVIAEYDNSGSLTCSYVYGQDRISMNRGGVAHFYVADGQGSVRHLTDASGNVTDLWTYSAFGEIINRLGSTPNTFTYTGEQWDPNAGYYYLRARWYNPTNGRFTSSDPDEGCIECQMSLHRYIYAEQNPINKKDPTGAFTLAGVMAVSTIQDVLSVPPVMVNSQLTYWVGLCKRDLWEIPEPLPDHHNVKVESRYSGWSLSPIVRGFFAKEPGYAFTQYIASLNSGSSVSGWVPGEVTEKGSPGECTMKEVEKERYEVVKMRILTSKANRYHLRKYNCQIWAAEQLR